MSEYRTSQPVADTSPPPDDAGPITYAVLRMEAQAAEFHELVEHLERRLASVLSPDGELVDAAILAERKPEAPLVRRLGDLADALDRTLQYLNKLSARCQL